MKRRILALTMLTVLTLTAAFAQSDGSYETDKTLATVSLHRTEPILYSQFMQNIQVIEQQQQQKVPESEYRTLLEQAVKTILLRQAAREEGVTVSENQIAQQLMQQVGKRMSLEQVKALVQQRMGVSWSAYVQKVRKNMIGNRYLQQKYQDKINAVEDPAPEEVQTYYENHPQEFIQPDMRRFSHIFLRTVTQQGQPLSDSEKQEVRDKAREILQQIQNGSVSFEQKVREESQDPNSQSRSGDVGFITDEPSQYQQLFGKSFVDKLFTLERNEIDLIESNVGYHIVKVTEVHNSRGLGLDDPISPVQDVTVRERIRAALKSQKQQQMFAQLAEEELARLRNQADITYFEENIDWE